MTDKELKRRALLGDREAQQECTRSEIVLPCPKCGKDIVMKKSKKGRRFYGCENNPDCDFMSWARPVAKPCPKCGGYMVRKGNKLVCANEECRHVEAATTEED